MRRLEGAGDNSSCQSKTRKLGNRPATRIDAARMLKRRLKDAGLSDAFSPHSFRATGITNFLENGGTLEVAQRIAGHATAGQRSSMIDVGKRFYSRIWKGFVTKTEGFSMPPPTGDQVFISYSHKDAPWRDDLDTHLKPYLRGSSIVSWSDQKIAPGSEWFSEIRYALANGKVAVLLVSPDFLASDFIHDHELGPLLNEAKRGGVKLLWVPICSGPRT